MNIHFIDVGLGNMVLVRTSVRDVLYDCYVTEDNERQVIGYLRRMLSSHPEIDMLICSHPDHVRGIKRLQAALPISTIADNGVPATNPDSAEYRDYLELRRKVGYMPIKARTNNRYGEVVFRWLNSAEPGYSDPDAQSVVLKLEHDSGRSCLLAGYTDARPWKEKILPFYNGRVKSDIFFAPSHGSLGFFRDPSDPNNYYDEHIKMINPALTVISVGQNAPGLPDKKAVELYTAHSTGLGKGDKLLTTERKGSIRLVVSREGDWTLSSDR